MHLLPVIRIKIAFHFASCHIRLYGVSRNYGNHSCVLDESKTFQALYSASVRFLCATIASYTIAFDLQFLKMEQNASLKCWMTGEKILSCLCLLLQWIYICCC